ncbi:MAG: hypothetical protein EAZ70_06980 [Runella slithyformis]|jgi:hypothetical protein|nr:MAG: hypothetical protein EAY79_06340 [Runella slithyformis]TAE99446.1 MAG: hypothetical protein EAZ80_04920 [Runella slithyformis]TAF27543.1 MAG: hypothetical protein EAZ70_06980 [Runella slithyformis]TAF46057.1 MAG: hypothetical protein EAZ63_09940 [Runella slithyformis]TAF82239.1 MAG: hypothetical protein EAZ50_04380 [Runella slithyformis]
MFLADKKEVEGIEEVVKPKPKKVKNAVGGRPKKDETKVKSKRLTLRFTVAEWDLLSKQSKVSNLSKADFLRQCSMQSKSRLPMRQLLPADVLDLLKNLEKLSGTILQLSHKVSHEKIVSAEIKQTALQVSNIVQRTYDYLEETL